MHKRNLKAWFAGAKRGHCPCGAVLPSERSKLCKRPECRQEYNRRYHLDRTNTAWRTVVSRSEPKDYVVTLTLSCRHTLDVAAHRAGYYKRKKCVKCASRRTSPGKRAR